MTFPDDLPWVIFYRCGSTSRIGLPRRPVHYVGTSGNTDARDVCPQIPYGCTGWKINQYHPWRPLTELPKHWLPFLDRERGSEMDPRPKRK